MQEKDTMRNVSSSGSAIYSLQLVFLDELRQDIFKVRSSKLLQVISDPCVRLIDIDGLSKINRCSNHYCVYIGLVRQLRQRRELGQVQEGVPPVLMAIILGRLFRVGS